MGRDNPGSTPGEVIWVDFILGHDGLAPLRSLKTTHDHPKEIADSRTRERERKGGREREKREREGEKDREKRGRKTKREREGGANVGTTMPNRIVFVQIISLSYPAIDEMAHLPLPLDSKLKCTYE